MPMNKKEYPENWEWLSKQIRKRNNGKCELCYAPNGAIVFRQDSTHHHPWVLNSCVSEQDKILKQTKIILTVHHINGNKMDSDERNLISLCQRCHLRLDVCKHMRNRKAKKCTAN
jgi:hypothetical protein